MHRHLTVLLLVLLPGAVLAHGSRIDWFTEGDSVSIQAFFDDGTPMAEASVTVFAASDPAEVWLSGTTDSIGRFDFAADRELSAEWDVRVRLAGHGDMVRIDLGDEARTGSTGFSAAQVVVMAVCVVWGLIGTALFFASRKRGER